MANYEHNKNSNGTEIIYAIGDVHGMANELEKILKIIIDENKSNLKTCRIIFVGDLIDRGYDSCGVIKIVRNALNGKIYGLPKTSVIMGNHEHALVHSMDHAEKIEAKTWINSECTELLSSYKIEKSEFHNWKSVNDHSDSMIRLINDVQWMKKLPLMISDKTLLFSHAGIDPLLNPQNDRDLLWGKPNLRAGIDACCGNIKGYEDKITVVHGHYPSSRKDDITTYRVNVDTAACYGGFLSAFKFENHQLKYAIQARRHHPSIPVTIRYKNF